MRMFIDSAGMRLVQFFSRASCWWIALCCVCLALLAPLALVDVPPVLDYPNHLARAYALAFGADDPALSRMVAPHWAIIPNLAIDVILPAMLRLLPVHVAGRVLLGVIVILPVLGCAALGRAVSGRRTYWSLASGLVACNELFLLGFMNFQLSAGLALVFASVWAMWRERRPLATTLIGMGAAAILFACHFMGLLFYLVLLAAIESPPIWDAIRRRRLPALAPAAFRLLPLLPAPLILYALSPLGHEAPEIGWWTIQYKLVHLATSFVNYDGALDLLTALAFAAFMVVCAATGRLRPPLAGGLCLAALGTLYLVSPFNFKGTSFLDVRFAVMFGFAVFAFAAPRLSARAACLVSLAFLGVFAARMLVVADVWRRHASELAELRQVIAPVQPGSRVLLATVAETDAPEYWRRAWGQTLSDGTRVDLHVASLLLIERHAFWAFLFAEPSQQPIRLLPPFQALAAATRNIPNARQLTGRAPTPEDLASFPIGTHWSCCYDYVLLLHRGALPAFSDPRLTPLHDGDYAALYRVRNTGPTVATLAPSDPAPYVPVLE